MARMRRNGLRRNVEPVAKQMIKEYADGAPFFDLDRFWWQEIGSPSSRETLVAMPVDDFLALAAPITSGEAIEFEFDGMAYTSPSVDPLKYQGVVDALAENILLSDIPYLSIGPANDKGEAKVTGHEGRHRATALQQLFNVDYIPVRIRSENFRWGEPPGPFQGRVPYRLIQEDGMEYCDCSFSGQRQVRIARYRTYPLPVSMTHTLIDPDDEAAEDDYDDADALDSLLGDLTARSNTTAKRTHPALWEAVKAEVTRGTRGGKRGQWSARKAQLAVKLYKERGGGYIGPKDPDNSLTRWTEQDWRTKSGRPSLETGERYLPADAIDALTDSEYGATSRAKRAGLRRGDQFTMQPPKIAEKTAKYRKNTEDDRYEYLWTDFGRHPGLDERLVTLMINGERRGFLRVKRDLDMPELANTAGCSEDLRRLYQKVRLHYGDSDFPVWQGWMTEIDYNYRNKGYGLGIYAAAINHIKKEMKEDGYAGFFLIPSFCGSQRLGGTTTEAAKRVWRSLGRRVKFGQGLVLFFPIPQFKKNRP